MSDQDTSRRFILKVMRENEAAWDKRKAFEMRGKHCPIQRPMCDRWPVKN